jgi:hypothetical protein
MLALPGLDEENNNRRRHKAAAKRGIYVGRAEAIKEQYDHLPEGR